MTDTPMSLVAQKVLVDPHPAWGGWVVAVIAGVVFVAFSVWIVMQRVKHQGHEGSGENE
jgi:hypothetical protein